LSAALGGAFVVETAAGAWEAITRMKEGRFALAVIDLDLPPAHGVAMSGWELARIFRAFNPGGATIFVTADWHPGLRTQADRVARSRVIEKPINPIELRSMVQMLRAQPAEPAEPGSR
jgi:CheY-like chemotaxis protein